MPRSRGIFRVKDWWWSKVSMLMGMLYLFVLWFHLQFYRFIPLCLASIITICGFASLGYLINDLFDISSDRIAGKYNFLTGKNPLIVACFFLISLALVLGPWIYLPADHFSYFLIVLEICCFLGYSIPPLRIKERDIWGVVTDAAYAHALPVALACYTFSLAAGLSVAAVPFILLLTWQLLCGVRNILIHQAEDLAADSISGSSSYVAKMGNEWFLSVIIPVMIVELFSATLFFICLSITYPGFWLFALAIFVYSNYVFLLYKGRSPSDMLSSSWRYYPNMLNERRLPYISLLLLSYFDLRFIFILAGHAILFDLHAITNTVLYFAGRLLAFLNNVLSGLYEFIAFILSNLLWSSFKLVINYLIYWFLRMWGIDLIKEKKSAFEYFKRGKRAP